MDAKKLIYPLVAVVSLLIIHSYASSPLVQLAAQGSYFDGLIQAFLGGYGNTLCALAALICSIIGTIRNLLSAAGGLGALLSGKLIGLLNLLITLVAIFGNGVVGYLKLIGGNERSREVYTSLLGTGFFEVVICVGLILAFFLKPKRESIN